MNAPVNRGALRAELLRATATVESLRAKVTALENRIKASGERIRTKLASYGISVPAGGSPEHAEAGVAELQTMVAELQRINEERAKEQVAACGFAPPQE